MITNLIQLNDSKDYRKNPDEIIKMYKQLQNLQGVSPYDIAFFLHHFFLALDRNYNPMNWDVYVVPTENHHQLWVTILFDRPLVRWRNWDKNGNTQHYMYDLFVSFQLVSNKTRNIVAKNISFTRATLSYAEWKSHVVHPNTKKNSYALKEDLFKLTPVTIDENFFDTVGLDLEKRYIATNTDRFLEDLEFIIYYQKENCPIPMKRISNYGDLEDFRFDYEYYLYEATNYLYEEIDLNYCNYEFWKADPDVGITEGFSLEYDNKMVEEIERVLFDNKIPLLLDEDNKPIDFEDRNGFVHKTKVFVFNGREFPFTVFNYKFHGYYWKDCKADRTIAHVFYQELKNRRGDETPSKFEYEPDYDKYDDERKEEY